MPTIQSLLFAIVQHDDAASAVQALSDANLKVTWISSVGGFLRVGNVTLLLALARKDIPRALEILSANCRRRTTFLNMVPPAPAYGLPTIVSPVEVEIGGATVFALSIERFVRMDPQHKVFTYEQAERSQRTMEMKLLMAIVPEDLADGILDMLVKAKYNTTLISTTGGILRKGNATLLIGVEASRVDDAVQQIEQLYAEALTKESAADPSTNLFVLDVERYEKI